MAIGKNKKLGKKGMKKKTVDPMSRKVWHDIRAPTFFDNRNVGKTIVNKSQGLTNANDSLKGRIVEASLADLNKDEEQAYRKFSLRIDEVQGRSCLTNFHQMDFTTDKIRSLVRKWQTTIEAHQDVKLTDGYVVRLFVIAFTKRRPNSARKTTYAQASQVRAIRHKMFSILKREIETCDIKELVQKLIPEVIGREIEKSTRSIYPLKDVFVHKVKIVKKPKFDVSRLIELHGGASNVVGAEDLGAKVKNEEFVEPAPLASV